MILSGIYKAQGIITQWLDIGVDIEQRYFFS